jgi:uncharacterized membrane protein YsdA (DUF1294 family)
MPEFVTQNPILCACIIYVAIVSLISIIVTIYDKSIAGKGKRRIPEATLLMWSALGGSVAMLLTMFAIRHKTQHKKFMIGIPLIIILQAALIFFVLTKFVF